LPKKVVFSLIFKVAIGFDSQNSSISSDSS
jgi:hypothetical protein